MAIREDVVQSAVQFLTNPKVQSSPLARRIAFLESKELTSEEIEEALARSKGTSGGATAVAAPPTLPAMPSAHAAAYHGHSHMVVHQQPGWFATATWKDLVLAAGLAGVAGYGVWNLAKTHLAPIVSWVTPASLDADRKSFESDLASTNASIREVREQTATITAALEKQRADLDQALLSLDGAIVKATTAAADRDAESRRLEEQVSSLNRLVPESMEKFREEQRRALSDVSEEFKSLKLMLLNRRPDAHAITSPSVPRATSLSHVAVSGSPGLPAWQLDATKAPESPASKPVAGLGAPATSEGAAVGKEAANADAVNEEGAAPTSS